MITVSAFQDFGHQDHGWLKACHHFSFADYYDPDRMGFGPLRVWNDDHIKAGTGFPLHPHKDMEIVTYIRKGAISHEDNLGNTGRTVAGQVQVMSAGTGIRHAEYNLEDEDLDLFQIWVHPDQPGHQPRWDQRGFDREHASHGFVTLVSGRGGVEHDGVLFIHADAEFKAAIMESGEETQIELEPGRLAYLVPARGSVEVNGEVVPERGSAAISAETVLNIKALEEAEVAVFDLPQ
ncbi:MAG: pirin family protein [Magnetovibrio sp.]|nr:pirin family protein [Magnetovibrio sp.]